MGSLFLKKCWGFLEHFKIIVAGTGLIEKILGEGSVNKSVHPSCIFLQESLYFFQYLPGK